MKITLFCLLTVFSVSIFGQTKTCNLALKDAPTIRGLKLEMPKQAVEKILPTVKLSNFLNYLNSSELSKEKGFESLKSLDIVFSENYSVSRLTFTYKDEVANWDSVIEFAESLSKNLNLPNEAWLFVGNKAEMKCTGFNVTARPNYISFESTKSDDELKKIDERKKKEFKP